MLSPVTDPTESRIYAEPRVRDRSINVTLNGQFLFAFELPTRRPGAIQLMAYDATADFDAIEIRHLPEGIMLKSGRKTNGRGYPALVELAEAELFAKAEYTFALERIAADNASLKGIGQGSEETHGATRCTDSEGPT